MTRDNKHHTGFEFVYETYASSLSPGLVRVKQRKTMKNYVKDEIIVYFCQRKCPQPISFLDIDMNESIEQKISDYVVEINN